MVSQRIAKEPFPLFTNRLALAIVYLALPFFPYTFRTPHSIFCFNAELFFLNFAYNTTAAHFSPVGMIRYWPHIALVEGVGSFIGSISFDDGKSAE